MKEWKYTLKNGKILREAIKEEDYEKILTELETCRKRIVSIATAKKGGNRVYRLNLQMFPLSEKIEPSKATPKTRGRL